MSSNQKPGLGQDGGTAADFEFPVEAGHIFLFNRALGQDTLSFSEHPASAVTAPPTFTQASSHYEPGYPLRPASGQPWRGSGRGPTGTAGAPEAAARLHAEQRFVYHRHPRAGEHLVVATRPDASWQKTNRDGVTLRFTSFVSEYRTVAGELLVESVKTVVEQPAAIQGEGSAQ